MGSLKGRWKIPDAQLAPALEALTEGATYAQACSLVGVCAQTIWMRVHAGAVRERRRRPDALRLDEREEIRVGIERGECDAAIGARLGRHRGTIGREIRANGGRRRYRAHRADERAVTCARRPKVPWTTSRPELWAEVQAQLRTTKWSPQLIARWLRREHPGEPEWWVSHEAIYEAIFVQAKGELRKELAACLKLARAKRHRGHDGRKTGHSGIVGMVNISERPAEAADRAVPGHWEGDLVKGRANRSAVATLVERSTRFGFLLKLEDQSAAHVAERIEERIRTLPEHLTRSLAWDQGREMAEHVRISVATGVPVYFCDPSSPWQRGSNEQWNGLVRMFLPKGIDLSPYSQEELDDIAALLNERPRETLGWDTPAERFAQLVALTG
jgi:IS30 family transposase